tara:strand:+ start:175 stop:1500 length:1326 start_codon:yes stop_codon:yes gene_type:complete
MSSYVFYGWWDYRFLSLIFLSTVVDYFVGLKIHDSNDKKTKKCYLWVSILFNLGLLGFFKYFNFFIDSWIDLLGTIGYEQKSTWTLNVILPVGISFYTFQTMSYSLDIYHGKLKPTKDFISFASFVSFFPQLVAGPIERASNLLPQILNNRTFKYEQGVQGLRLILYGMFKKVVIADSLAPHVDTIFENYATLNGGVLLLGLIYFSFQIYCDFSGYSDIAIGTSKLFGFELMSNFKFPYFSRDIGEFWRRWHISLSTWFRDYLYIPLGGSKGGKWLSIRNIFIIFIVSGFWHGANWTFIMWGLIHAMLYIPLFLKGKNRQHTTTIVAEDKWLPSLKELFQMWSTFFFTMIAWVFFRSATLLDSVNYIYHMFTKFAIPTQYRFFIIYVFILTIFDWLFRQNERELFQFHNIFFRYAIYVVLIFSIIFLLVHSKITNFIYFQF